MVVKKELLSTLEVVGENRGIKLPAEAAGLQLGRRARKPAHRSSWIEEDFPQTRHLLGGVTATPPSCARGKTNTQLCAHARPAHAGGGAARFGKPCPRPLAACGGPQKDDLGGEASKSNCGGLTQGTGLQTGADRPEKKSS